MVVEGRFAKVPDMTTKTAVPVQMVYSPETIRIYKGLAADITGGQPTTILRDEMPDKLDRGIYMGKP